MKDKNSLIVGVLFGLLFLLLFNGILCSLIYSLVGIDVGEFSFGALGFHHSFSLNSDVNNYANSLLLLLPIVLDVFVIELTFFLLNRSKKLFIKKMAITFVLLIVGYIIVFVFYGLIKLVLVPANTSLWNRLVSLWHLEGSQIFVFVFFIIIVLFAYLQITQKRLMNYIGHYTK